jgi:hypothetical protein
MNIEGFGGQESSPTLPEPTSNFEIPCSIFAILKEGSPLVGGDRFLQAERGVLVLHSFTLICRNAWVALFDGILDGFSRELKRIGLLEDKGFLVFRGLVQI